MRKLIVKLSVVLAIVAMVLGACSSKDDSITIGTITTTEVKLLAHMYKELIEANTDISVEIKQDLAASPIVIEGMQNGDIDLSTQYTGTAVSSFFEIEHPDDPEATLQQAKDEFSKDPFNFKFYDPLGFENTYAFTVTREIAEEYNLQKVSDLEGLSENFSAGFDTAWLERENDGYPAFVKTYNIEFKETNPMEINLVYDAVNNGEVDIVLAYTTDPRIVAYDLVMLEDDRNFFPPYDAVPAIRQETLDKHPEIEEAIAPLIGLFDEEIMGALNGKVDLDGEEIEDVAIEFLKEQNLLD